MTFNFMEFIRLHGQDLAIMGLVLIGFLAILILWMDVKEQKIKRDIQRKYAKGEL